MSVGTTTLAADGPIDQGSFMLGGNAYFQSQSDDVFEDSEGNPLTTVAVASEVAAFAIRGLAVGVQFELLTQNQGELEVTESSVGPHVTYYLSTNGDREKIRGSIYPYVGGFVAFGSRPVANDGKDENAGTFMFGGDLGTVVMISNNVGLDVGFNFKRERYEVAIVEATSPTINYEYAYDTILSIGVGIKGFLF
jgi:hypothetical protein